MGHPREAEESTEPEVYFTIRMPRSVRDKLDRLGKRNERSASAEARLAIYAHLEKAERPV